MAPCLPPSFTARAKNETATAAGLGFCRMFAGSRAARFPAGVQREAVYGNHATTWLVPGTD